MDTYTRIFDILVFISGIYMIHWSISGDGPLYKSENIKKGMEQKYKKLIKWFCLFGGIIAIATGAFDYLKIEPVATILFVALCIIVALSFVIIISFTENKKVGKNKT